MSRVCDEPGGTIFLLPEAFHRPGGIQTHNRTQVQALRRCRPYEPLTVLVLNDAPHEAEVDEWRALRRQGFAGDRWRFARAALSAARQQRPSRVILGHRNFLPLAPLLRAIRPSGERWLLTYGIEAQPRLSALEWFCLTSCERVFAISPQTAAIFREAGAQTRIDLWPCSLPWDWPLPEPTPARLRAPYRLLTVSRLAPPERHKGIDDVIRAVKGLRQAGCEVDLDIVGEGEDRERLGRLAASEGVTGCVKFLGRLDNAQLRERYAGCDVFVLPSGAEGFGIVYLEAMAHARPVVAAEAAGAPFVVRPGESGWLVPYGRPAELARCLLGLLKDPAGTSLGGQRGRGFLEREFSFEAACRTAARLLERA